MMSKKFRLKIDGNDRSYGRQTEKSVRMGFTAEEAAEMSGGSQQGGEWRAVDIYIYVCTRIERSTIYDRYTHIHTDMKIYSYL